MMSDAEKPPKPITPQQAIEAVEGLRASGAAGALERRTKLAEDLIAGMEKASGISATEAQKQRITATVYKHTLLDAGEPEHAKALKDWITLGRVHDAIEAELKTPSHQPFLSILQIQSPYSAKYLLEEVSHGDHSHTHVNTLIKSCLQDLDISHNQADPEIMPAAETAMQHYRATKQISKAALEKYSNGFLPPIISHSDVGSTFSGCGTGGCGHDHSTPSPVVSVGHVCGNSCNHGEDASVPRSPSRDGVHYHGDTPCTHSHPNEPHLPEGKSKAVLWVAGIVASVGIGAYLINEYGKPKKKEIEQKSLDWKDRAQPPTTSEARTL